MSHRAERHSDPTMASGSSPPQRRRQFGSAVFPESNDYPRSSRSRGTGLTEESLALHEAQQSLSQIRISGSPSPLARHNQRERYPSLTPSATSISEGPDGDEDGDDGRTMGSVEAAREHQQSKGKGKEVERDEESRASASMLPTEILILIFGSLSDPKDVYNCLQVNWTWCEAAHSFLWQRPILNSVRRIAAVGRVLRSPDTLQSYADAVRRINMSSLDREKGPVSDDMLLAFTDCIHAERLTMGPPINVSSTTLCTVFKRMPKLVAVDINGNHQADDRAIATLAESCSALQGLNISSCERVGDEGVLRIAKHCKDLRRLKAAKCIRLTDKSLVAIARDCPLLIEVDFAGLGQATSATVYAIFLNLTELREFKFSQNPFITNDAFPNLPALAAMHQIDSELAAIRAPKYATTVDLDPTSRETPRMLMPKEDCLSLLRVVDLTDCPNFGDLGLENLVESAPRIRQLTLAKCTALTDAGLQHIAKFGRNLHHLHLAHVALITDGTMAKIARACTRLRYVDLACCPLLTDMSVFELATNIPKLKRVGLVKVVNITDQAIYALVERASTLERLHLSYCDKLTVSAIAFLLNRLTRLTHLSLTGVSAFKYPELKQFCRPAPPDFNDHQREVFCVFSGPGIAQLRKYLSPHICCSDDGSARRDSASSDDSVPTPIRNIITSSSRTRQGSADQGPADPSISSAMGSAFASVTPNFLSPDTIAARSVPRSMHPSDSFGPAHGSLFPWTSSWADESAASSSRSRFLASSASRHRGSEPATRAERTDRSSVTHGLPPTSSGVQAVGPSSSTTASTRGFQSSQRHRDGRVEAMRRGSTSDTVTRSFSSHQTQGTAGDGSRRAPVTYVDRLMQLAGINRDRNNERERGPERDRETEGDRR